MSEIRIWLKLFVYNHYKRHWHNFLFRLWYFKEWKAEGRDHALFPKSGKISREAWDWAQRIAKDEPATSMPAPANPQTPHLEGK